MSWAQERRANRAAEAEQARLDADAASARRMRERAAVAEQSRQDRAATAKRDRAERHAAAQARAARWARLRGCVTTHRVALLIYPLALVSAVMAIPAMADYGYRLYGTATGLALPVITELGMWAFALAVQLTRTRHAERPVWALQAGVWGFAAVSFSTNALHGAERGPAAAVVMGVASVSGVAAHQLVTASARRSRAERHAARVARRGEAKTARVRRAAVAQAVAELDTAGRARLVFTPGRYTLTRARLSRRPRLTEALDPTPAGSVPGMGVGVAEEAAAWLAGHGPIGDRDGDGADDGTQDRGPIATLDPGSDQRKSRPQRGGSIPSPAVRSIETLRRELTEAVAADPDSIDVDSAESIRRALRCSPTRARQLRDEHRQEGNE